MKKLYIFFIVFAILAMGLSLSPVFAKNDKNLDIPEQDGIYDVPGHPDLKIRVFVHKIKPAKPSPTPTPELNCTVSDPSNSADVAFAGWKLPSIYKYNLNPASVPGTVGGGNLATIAATAFNRFSGAIGNKVVVTAGLNTTKTAKALDGINLIAWGKASAGTLGVTYIWYNPTTEAVTELDTIMNNRYIWYWTGNTTCAYSGVYDAQNILTHEIGHWFGLDDHYTSGYVDATMYGYGSTTEVKKNTLTNGDINGLKAIY